MAKIQGEGDYESARRYNEHARQDVEGMSADKLRAAKPTAGEEAQGAKARDAAKKHAKHGEQDVRDAEVFRRKESKQP